MSLFLLSLYDTPSAPPPTPLLPYSSYSSFRELMSSALRSFNDPPLSVLVKRKLAPIQEEEWEDGEIRERASPAGEMTTILKPLTRKAPLTTLELPKTFLRRHRANVFPTRSLDSNEVYYLRNGKRVSRAKPMPLTSVIKMARDSYTGQRFVTYYPPGLSSVSFDYGDFSSKE